MVKILPLYAVYGILIAQLYESILLIQKWEAREMNLEGKTVEFLGDSITEGVGVADIPGCRYDNRLKKMLGLGQVHNYGIGGTRLAHQSVPSEKPRYDLCFCGRAYNMDKNADLIVVYGGVNDWIHGDAPFGEMTDTTPATFCGGVDFLMRLLKSEYPDVPVVFMTPAHANFEGMTDALPSARKVKKPDAKPLAAYVDVIAAKGREYCIPVLNLYHELGIDPNRLEDKEKYTADGLHFNDEGHAVLANCLAHFLKAL